MYKIYNNEIKITQNLKGGVTAANIVGIEDIRTQIFNGSNKFKRQYLNKNDVKHIVPLNGNNIDFETLTDATQIEADIKLIAQAFFVDSSNENDPENEAYTIFNKNVNDFINPSNPPELQTYTPINPTTLEQKKKAKTFNMNVLRYAMSWAKEIELYDAVNEKLLTHKEYMEKMFKDPSTVPSADPGRSLQPLFDDAPFKAIIKGLEYFLNNPEYAGIKKHCDTMYPKIVSKHSLPHWMGFGGGYDNLKYSLDGGVLSTLIRVPDLAKHYKAQLSVLESKLKMSNKTLSSVSKNKINTVIDQLEKHEKFLKDTFELLRNSPLIDENKVDFEAHETKLKKAKMSLRKHDRYRSFLTDIIKTINDANESLKPKAYFS